jgi:radical SAM protein with 4Fe4S-binding SPASM domain
MSKTKIEHLLNLAKLIINSSALRNMHQIISERPISIALQTFDACNSRCVFCARRKIKETFQLMSMELFNHICTIYSDIGGGHISFSPLLADPLVDPLLISRIELIRSSFPDITPSIFTNGIGFSKLTDSQLKLILNTIHHLDISIGGFDRNSYLTMFGVDKFDIVWSQIQRIIEINSSLSIPAELKIHIRTNQRNETKLSDLIVTLKSFGINYVELADSYSSWGGLVTEDDLPDGAMISIKDNSNYTSPCFVMMYHMMIMPDGRVLACGCMDATEIFNVGNLSDKTLKELWVSDKYEYFRDLFRQKAMPPICKSCSYYSPYEEVYSNIGLASYSTDVDFWSSLK